MPMYLKIASAVSQGVFSRELDEKWRRQDLNHILQYGMRYPKSSGLTHHTTTLSPDFFSPSLSNKPISTVIRKEMWLSLNCKNLKELG